MLSASVRMFYQCQRFIDFPNGFHILHRLNPQHFERLFYLYWKIGICATVRFWLLLASRRTGLFPETLIEVWLPVHPNIFPIAGRVHVPKQFFPKAFGRMVFLLVLS